MQDRYVGDVGKYGLLRSLCRGDEQGAALRLGVHLYRFDGDDSAAVNDGRHTDYLFAPSRHERFLRQCDPDLFERMLHLVNNDRSIGKAKAHDELRVGFWRGHGLGCGCEPCRTVRSVKATIDRGPPLA